MKRQLDRVFNPRSIAVIGASNKLGKVGYLTYQNIKNGGYKGKLYPVNLKHAAIQGDTAFKRLKDIPEQVDLAIIATPADTVVNLVEACGKAAVGGILILTAGFKEAGKIGQEILDKISALAKQYQMRIIGPNSLGFIRPVRRLNASFTQQSVQSGKIAFITQSGALATSILDWASNQNIGFSYFISSGSMINVGFHDLIDYCATDSQTACILIYMESLETARPFISAARNFARSKPIILLKAGTSLEGAKAAFSHTGRLAGNDRIYTAAFQRAGIIRVSRIAQLFHCAQAFSTQPRPKGNRLVIITNTGAAGVLATDYLCKNGGQLAPLSQEAIKTLDQTFPQGWSKSNPIDLLGDATSKEFEKAIQTCLKLETVDGILVILTPQHESDPTEIAKTVVQVAKKSHKTILTVWMGEDTVEEGRKLLDQGGVPSYRYPESAVDAFVKMYQYNFNIQLLYETPPTAPEQFQPKYEVAQSIIHQAMKEERTQLSLIEVKHLLESYDISVVPYRMVQSEEQAIHAASQIGFPVAMKIVVPNLIHKSSVGGVQLNITSWEEVHQAYQTLVENASKHQLEWHGVLIEKMVYKQHELVIGAKKDNTFGPAILFGKGGITVDIFQDVNIGLPPLNMALAQRLIESTKAHAILNGESAYPAVDLEQLKFMLCKFSYLVMDFPMIQEIEINPYVVDKAGGVALDGVVNLDLEMPITPRFHYPHLVISPYPSQYVKSMKMKNGADVLLRPIRPEDEPLEAELFDYLSENTIYFRFFGYRPKLTHELLTRFTHIDYDREIAIVAEVEVEGKKRLAGVVRIISDAWNEAAEYAIVVADDFQGQGLGKALTNFILEIAKERGIQKVFASVLSSNKRMLSMFRKRDFEVEKEDFQTYSVQKWL